MDKSILLKYAAQIKSSSDLSERKIVARVVGVTFEERQQLLDKITPETSMMLERDRRNEYDFYAVKVMALVDDQWQHIGFIPKTMSKKLSNSLDQGAELKCSVNKLKGGMVSEVNNEKLNFGLDITIEGKMQN